MGGPLTGVRAVELAGRGPGPFGAMMLADLGAEVIRVCRVEDVASGDGGADEAGGIERMIAGRRRIDLVTRGRRSIAVDLKHPDGLAAVRRLIERADVLVEGFRPGVAERLGIGPPVCLELNPRLVYARITGWGQDGPYASTPGHDINYVALAGALDPLRASPGAAPAPPLNMLGDYGGGGMLLAVGILSALVERSRSGRGQVVDAAMIDGVALLTTLFHARHQRAGPRSAVLQRLRDRRRPVRDHRVRRAAVLRVAGAQARAFRRPGPLAGRSGLLARRPRRAGGGVQDQDA